MSDTRWTAGPWFVNKQPHGIFVDPVEGDDGVADVLMVSGFDDARQQANANLIAAAPDLYAALDWLCRALVHDHNKNIDYWTEALAALAKARGEGAKS